uniref:C-C motif chemokine receptor 6 n=1 Tax=Erpetoichthys calabaricus TaxID=27687 RepID=A0A8C4RFD8_ERPCA
MEDYESDLYNETEGFFEYDINAYPCNKSNIRDMINNIMIYVYSIIMVLGLIGNGLVITTYAFYKKPKSMTDVFLLNVAIADILFDLSLPLFTINQLNNWIMGNFTCKLLKGIYSVNLYSGMLLLACIGSDRYIAIVQARRSFNLRSTALIYSHVICFCVWLVGIAVSLPTFIFYETFEVNNSTVCDHRFQDNETAIILKTAMPAIQLSIGFFLPLVIIIFCYSSIIFTLLHTRNFQRHKAVRVVVAVVIVFVFCHLPYNIVFLIDLMRKFRTDRFCLDETNHSKMIILTETLAFFHSCLNPVLYAFIGVKFRNHFRKILQDLWCISKKYISVRRPSRFTSEMYMSRKTSEVYDVDNGSSFTM